MPQIWVVIVLVFSVINIINKASKQKQAQQNSAAKAQPARQNVSKNVSNKPQQQQAPAPQPAFHETRPLEAHMHEPQMGVEGEGTEGVDCCHEYMLSDTPQAENAVFMPLQEQGEDEKAKALLQGVIFSEILGRRPIKRYGGKRA